MRYRILNRLAQRYLVKRTGEFPVVGIPGSDLVETATWHAESSGDLDTFDLMTATEPRRRLHSVGDQLKYDEATSGRSGSWSFEDVGDGSGYGYILSVADNNLALGVDATKLASDEFPLALLVGKGRAAMWQLGNECVADARSIHLRYQTPDSLFLFYNEVYPDKAPPGTFFCTSGFGANSRGRAPSGYGGIQQQADGSRIAIFSVWHRMADETRPLPAALATTVGAHPGAHSTAFTGEGSGSSIRLPISWSIGEPVRMAVTADPLNNDTVISAFVAAGEGPWTYLGAINRADTGGLLLANTYAFIEDYARSGNTPGLVPAARSPYRIRSARFANPWYLAEPSASGAEPVVSATVTAYSPHVLENLKVAQADAGSFGLAVATGGDAAESAPPLGIRHTDPNLARRIPPILDGVPYPC